jgi:hypothetical protein
LEKLVESFSEQCATLLGNADYSEASDLIQQSDRLLNTSYEEVLRKLQLMGQTMFREQLKSDSPFWAACIAEWGKGAGYRDRVSRRNTAWFTDQQREELEQDLQKLIEREWKQVLRRVTALFDDDQ